MTQLVRAPDSKGLERRKLFQGRGEGRAAFGADAVLAAGGRGCRRVVTCWAGTVSTPPAQIYLVAAPIPPFKFMYWSAASTQIVDRVGPVHLISKLCSAERFSRRSARAVQPSGPRQFPLRMMGG